MGLADKAKNAAQDVAGKAKEVVGKVTGDDDLRNEGKADQGKSSLKKAGENIKDAACLTYFERVADGGASRTLSA